MNSFSDQSFIAKCKNCQRWISRQILYNSLEKYKEILCWDCQQLKKLEKKISKGGDK